MVLDLKKIKSSNIYCSKIKSITIIIKMYAYNETEKDFICGYLGVVYNSKSNNYYSTYLKYKKVLPLIDTVKIIAKVVSGGKYLNETVYLNLKK